MALPATTYDKATLVNPTAALTDFTLMVDLSRLSAAWWALVDTSEGRKGRAAKDDGTELAVDFMDFDNVAKTGWARIKWTGTLATTGIQSVRIYPPILANSTVIRSTTFGAYNAYDSDWIGYWPLMEDANDRTVNQLAGAITVGMGIGDVTGKVGKATNFNGTTESIGIPFDAVMQPTGGELTISAWVSSSVGTNSWAGIISRNAPSANVEFELGRRGASTKIATRAFGVGESTGGGFTGGTNHYVGTIDSGGSDIYENNINVDATPGTGTATFTTDGSNTNDLLIGEGSISAGKLWDGNLEEIQMHNVARSAAWVSEEFDQTNDQAAFWGTWANVPVASARRVMAVL